MAKSRVRVRRWLRGRLSAGPCARWAFVAVTLFMTAPAGAEPSDAQPAAARNVQHGDFDPRRRLGDEEYAEKAEGGYLTGLPLINYDSNTGLGFGARAYYFFDGERSDPRFAYTPYLYRMFLQAFATTGGYQFHWLDVEGRHVLGLPFH